MANRSSLRGGYRGAVRRTAVGIGGPALALLLAACATVGDADAHRILLPEPGPFDYQLGGVSELPEGVTVVARDSTAEPAEGAYSICYVNGFQTQPGEGEHWLAEHPELVLRDAAGEPFADPGWPDEYLLDTSTDDTRSEIAALLGTVIASCATSGFDAVEIDNLDTWTRSDGLLTIEGALDLAARYARVAHDLGLAIAQKNGAGQSARFRDEVGFDFAVTEECMRYDECADYLDAYDGRVFDIEYGSAEEFVAYCADSGHPAAMIRRDLGLVPAGSPAHVYDTCP